jgi:hypothetical protein
MQTAPKESPELDPPLPVQINWKMLLFGSPSLAFILEMITIVESVVPRAVLRYSSPVHRFEGRIPRRRPFIPSRDFWHRITYAHYVP